MTTTITPNMSMVIPVPSSEPGPTWAQELVTAFTNILDVHDHTSGKGLKVPSGGLNINSDLSFGGFNLTTIRTLRLSSQGAVLTGGTEIGELYRVLNELYFNDGAGNQVKITNAGAVNVSGSNGIGGDYGGGNPAALNF